MNQFSGQNHEVEGRCTLSTSEPAAAADPQSVPQSPRTIGRATKTKVPVKNVSFP